MDLLITVLCWPGQSIVRRLQIHHSTTLTECSPVQRSGFGCFIFLKNLQAIRKREYFLLSVRSFKHPLQDGRKHFFYSLIQKLRIKFPEKIIKNHKKWKKQNHKKPNWNKQINNNNNTTNKPKPWPGWLHWNEFDRQMAAMKSRMGHVPSHVSKMKAL